MLNVISGLNFEKHTKESLCFDELVQERFGTARQNLGK